MKYFHLVVYVPFTVNLGKGRLSYLGAALIVDRDPSLYLLSQVFGVVLFEEIARHAWLYGLELRHLVSKVVVRYGGTSER